MIKSDSWFKSADKKKKCQSMGNLHLFFHSTAISPRLDQGSCFYLGKTEENKMRLCLKLGKNNFTHSSNQLKKASMAKHESRG